MSIITITATDDAAGTRIEKWLAANDELGITRNRADTLVRGGNVSINGKNIIKTYKLKSGDLISIDMPEPVELNAEAENIPLDIVYEDDDLLFFFQ